MVRQTDFMFWRTKLCTRISFRVPLSAHGNTPVLVSELFTWKPRRGARLRQSPFERSLVFSYFPRYIKNMTAERQRAPARESSMNGSEWS